MTSENLNIILTNAVCCASKKATAVSKLLSLGNKCAAAELVKLKLLVDYIETLRCYKIDPVTSLFQLTLPYNSNFFRGLSLTTRLYVITVNGVQYSMQGDGILTRFEILEAILATIPNVISYSLIEDPDGTPDRQMFFSIEATCDTTSITYSVYEFLSGLLLNSRDFGMYRAGLCTVTNCLTEDQFNILVKYVMSMCDICECQLVEIIIPEVNISKVPMPIIK